MINLSLPYRPLLKKLYRIARMAVFGLAALYVAMLLVYAATFTGAGFGALAFTVSNLKADAWDMASVLRYKTFGVGLGVGVRPTRYALICEERGNAGEPKATEAENAKSEQDVRGQISDHSGYVYNEMMEVIAQGYAQPVLLLWQGRGGAKVCGARDYGTQNCSCGGKFQGVERSRIPASVIFGPGKEIKFGKQG
jgi:hypothetical protein